MRGTDGRTGELFSYVDLEHRVPAEHPLRVIRRIANEALETQSADFSELYSGMGRPSPAATSPMRPFAHPKADFALQHLASVQVSSSTKT